MEDDMQYYYAVTCRADIYNIDGLPIDEWQYSTDGSITVNDKTSRENVEKAVRMKIADEVWEAAEDYEINEDNVVIDRDNITYDIKLHTI